MVFKPDTLTPSPTLSRSGVETSEVEFLLSDSEIRTETAKSGREIGQMSKQILNKYKLLIGHS